MKANIQQLALSHGFDSIGFASPDLAPHHGSALDQFLAQGFHGEMAWMEDKRDRRVSPRDIWPEVQSILVLGHNYGPASDPLTHLSQTDRGTISVYAQHKDYHDVIKKKLKALARDITGQFGGDARVYVDTAPILEKPVAAMTQIGWQGKHSCVVSREFGSWLFLGEIFISLPIPPDAAEPDHCGTCQRCLDICPTNAFVAPYQLDARKCISYLTIEHKSHIPREFRKAIGNRIYGCDDCLAVCPWNKFAQTAREIAYHPRDDLTSPQLASLVRLDDAAFRALFSGSPIKRIGRDRFVRNVLIAIGNSGKPALAAAIRPLLADDSPLVRAACVWALAELLAPRDFFQLRDFYFSNEHDRVVREEWSMPHG